MSNISYLITWMNLYLQLQSESLLVFVSYELLIGVYSMLLLVYVTISVIFLVSHPWKESYENDQKWF